MKSYIELYPLSDAAILEELGSNLKRIRLNQNMSQQELADRAGVDRITIGKMEAGRPATTLTLVQVLRALQRLDVLADMLNEPQIMPGMLKEKEEHYRKRASRPRDTHKDPSDW